MFFHRLKTEIRENRIYLIFWAATLAVLSFSALSFWNSDIKINPDTGRPDNSLSDFLGLLIIPLVAIPIVCTITSFRQDNLKDPRAFWNTRPIRPTTLHTVKFVFLHLFLTLPLSLCTFIIAANATSFSTAMLSAGEAALWCAGAIHLSAFAALHNHQWSKLLLMPATGLLGIMITALIVSRLDLLPPSHYHPSRSASNLLITVFVLFIIFAIAGIALIKKPKLNFPVWSSVLLGALTFPLLSANWLPDLALSGETVKLEPAEPITDFTTAHTRHNQQHYYYLNYHLNNLLPETEGMPVQLVSYQIVHHPAFESNPPMKVDIRSWNSGTDQFPGEKNLESIALDRPQHSNFQVSLSVGIPHDHQVSQTPAMDDIPRKNITVEGSFVTTTAFIEDAMVINPDKPFQQNKPGQFFSYQPATKKTGSPLIYSKSFQLPLASTALVQSPRRYHRDALIFMRHRETGHYFHIPDGSSGSRSGLFGAVRYSEIQNPEDTPVVNHYWKNYLQHKFPDFPDFNEWKKDAELLILPPEQFKTVTVPFKVTIALPDPKILQQRLNELPE